MGEFWLTGEHAGSVANYLVTNDVSRLEDGGALYTLLCNEGGTVVDDLIVYRHAADRILIVCNASNRDKVGAHLARFCENHCDLRDASDETGLIALQGPKAAAILAAAGPEAAAAVAETKSFRFRSFPVAGVTVTAARTGYTGEDGFELFCPWNDTPAVWRELLRLGESAGIKPVGLGARDTLRLEARLSLYGNEIDETTDPLEAGLGWAVKLEKGDFVGREALLARKAAGPSRKMVGFEMTGRGIARHGYPIKNDAGETVGLCTSGGPSPTTGKNIGLGYVPTELAAVGATLLVDCRGRDTAAVVVKTPFYKANKAGALSPPLRGDPPWQPKQTCATTTTTPKTTSGSPARATSSSSASRRTRSISSAISPSSTSTSSRATRSRRARPSAPSKASRRSATSSRPSRARSCASTPTSSRSPSSSTKTPTARPGSSRSNPKAAPTT
jgi:aminomethyltransferase